MLCSGHSEQDLQHQPGRIIPSKDDVNSKTFSSFSDTADTEQIKIININLKVFVVEVNIMSKTQEISHAIIQTI